LSSNNPDVGDAREELDVDYAGDPLSIAFNARYLMDALTAVKAKEVRIDLRDESSPTQLRPTDDDDALAVVMPMRV
jgi:DNA polymerase-3 subunit beta